METVGSARNAFRLALGLTLAALTVAAPAAGDVVAAGCNICKSSFLFFGGSYCVAVPSDGTVGVTECTEVYGYGISKDSCYEQGNACSVVNAGGGGGGGTGGGGGSGGGCVGGASGCPAQCFSCGGGGQKF